MENFTPYLSTIGGILIGLSAAMMLGFNGRIAGISGIFNGVILPEKGELGWRLIFVLGLLLGGALMMLIMPTGFAITIERAPWMVALAGVLVGFGTRLGSGCTSGHGVCGLARFSARSLVATLSFIVTGAITVFVMNLILGGAQ